MKVLVNFCLMFVISFNLGATLVQFNSIEEVVSSVSVIFLSLCLYYIRILRKEKEDSLKEKTFEVKTGAG